MSSSNPQYYTMPARRVLNMIIDAERTMRLCADKIKLTVRELDNIEDWEALSLGEYMEGYLGAKALIALLNKRVKDPDPYVVTYLKDKYPDGVLLTKDDLTILHKISTNLEEIKQYLFKLHGFTTQLN